MNKSLIFYTNTGGAVIYVIIVQNIIKIVFLKLQLIMRENIHSKL